MEISIYGGYKDFGSSMMNLTYLSPCFTPAIRIFNKIKSIGNNHYDLILFMLFNQDIKYLRPFHK
jgi:hypothetical protein